MFQVIQNTFNFIRKHPLGAKHPARALSNWAGWQVRCRLSPGPHSVPFVGSTRLLVSRGMHGATGNIYCGLHEFEDMAFVMHFLRSSDLFVDVGANIGSYTVIASGVCGARSISVEPVAKTAAALSANIELNKLQPLVRQERSAVGAKAGSVRFSDELDCMNRVLGEEESLRSFDVTQTTLDALLGGECPFLVKIDVEGYEMAVLKGAEKTLADPGLRAVIVEANGSGKRYGSVDQDIHDCLGSAGFVHYRYNPFNRRLSKAGRSSSKMGNALFVRDLSCVQERVESAPRHLILGEKV